MLSYLSYAELLFAQAGGVRSGEEADEVLPELIAAASSIQTQRQRCEVFAKDFSSMAGRRSSDVGQSLLLQLCRWMSRALSSVSGQSVVNQDRGFLQI